MTTPISFMERAKIAQLAVKSAVKSAKKTESTAEKTARLAIQLDQRVARWANTFESVMLLTAETNSNIVQRQRAGKLIVKLARYIETGKLSGSRSASTRTVTRSASGWIAFANGNQYTAIRKQDVCNMVRRFEFGASTEWAGVNVPEWLLDHPSISIVPFQPELAIC
mgnify:CR=1 FL=1